MTPIQITVIAVVVIVIAGVALVLMMRNRTNKLREQFGPEYDRAVQEKGSKHKAEAELEKLEKRVRKYDLQPLSPLTAIASKLLGAWFRRNSWITRIRLWPKRIA